MPNSKETGEFLMYSVKKTLPSDECTEESLLPVILRSVFFPFIISSLSP
jgi:hypothetical protein